MDGRFLPGLGPLITELALFLWDRPIILCAAAWNIAMQNLQFGCPPRRQAKLTDDKFIYFNRLLAWWLRVATRLRTFVPHRTILHLEFGAPHIYISVVAPVELVSPVSQPSFGRFLPRLGPFGFRTAPFRVRQAWRGAGEWTFSRAFAEFFGQPVASPRARSADHQHHKCN